MLLQLFILTATLSGQPADDSTGTGRLDQAHRNALADQDFAFPKQRKEPLEDARHVRSAVARFNRVKDVTEAERDEAWRRIEAAAKRFGVELSERDWRELPKPRS
jgi:hypothetical protein